MSKKISESLNMFPIEEVKTNSIEPIKKASKEIREANDNDFDYARENLYSVIERGTDALEEMLDVAAQSQHPRAYEVVSTIMKTLLDANKDLVEMSDKKKAQKEDEENPKSGPDTINQSMHFHGSTEDMRKLIEKMKNDESS